MALAKITLKKKEERRLLRGHPWVFSNEIATIEGDPSSGEYVQIFSSSGKNLGFGFFNRQSLISFRFWDKNLEACTDEELKKRLMKSNAMRNAVLPDARSYRMVHGEADDLPGLIIDRYEDTYCIQTLSTGIDRSLQVIVDILCSAFSAKNVIERNDSPLRVLEGLPEQKKVLLGSAGIVHIEENGIHYEIDPLNGQKTGFFLDQRNNRALIRSMARGASVLDLFSNQGGFLLNAIKGDAREGIANDISTDAITQIQHNLKLNPISNRENFGTAAKDTFEYLKQLYAERRTFDLVICDPPSFTKSKKSLPSAMKGYLQLNILALKIVSKGGFLATASCSHHFQRDASL